MILTRGEIVAKRVLSECGLEDPTEVPLPDIIFGRRAFYQERPLDQKDGEIVTVGSRSIVTINSNIPFETRRRFAAAHELGHYELHRKLAPVYLDTEMDLINWYQHGEHETEANQFAAEFLMPSKIFKDEARGKKVGPTTLEYLADRFQVSKTAAILRYVKCGDYPVCVVFCRENRMRWWKMSEDFGLFLNFASNLPPPTDSVAYELFTTNQSYRGEEQKQTISKSTWFSLKRGERDTQFFEYCLYVPSFDYTLSVIWGD